MVRGSRLHGRGVFANLPIAAGETIFEYTGERIGWEEGDRRYPVLDDTSPHHTFLFSVDDDTVIDGGARGNSSRFINHSCDPNCETVTEDGRVWIHALRDIQPGEELTYDYHLVLPGRRTKADVRRYACHCGARRCRGTMLEPVKRRG